MVANNIAYTVRIFPDGEYDSYGNTKAEYTILFATSYEKQKYIKDEMNYCKDVYAKYVSSFGENIKPAREVLIQKRVEFAKTQGFIPNPRNKYVWIRR